LSDRHLSGNFVALRAQSHLSPGQRPGCNEQKNIALKGAKQTESGPFVMRFSAKNLIDHVSHGVAVGYSVSDFQPAQKYGD
jgi:hypothetical protein